MTTPARVKEADIMRVLRAAKKLGAKHVRVEPDGSIDIALDKDEQPLPPPPPVEVKTIW
jgi:hypothetical protein